jgi:hypothetical protein
VNRYRATIWYLSEMVNCIEGDAGIKRRIVEYAAESRDHFRALMMDLFVHQRVDDQIWFGPITEKRQ